MAYVKETADLLTNLFYQYVQEQGAHSFVKPGRSGRRYLNRTNTTKAGGMAAPHRVNERNSAWKRTFRGSSCGKDCKKVATRGYVKQALLNKNVGKEVTANSGTLTCGTLVDYRMCKNIDKGVDEGDRQRSTITFLGFRFFGSLTLNQTALTPVRVRFILVQDKTPQKPIREGFFSTISDARTPVDFVDGTTTAPINAVRPINPDRFVVKHDWVERLGGPDPTTNVNGNEPNYGRSVVFNRYFKINRKISFNADYLTDATELTPSYHLIYFPLNDFATDTTTVAFNFQFEEFFSD